MNSPRRVQLLALAGCVWLGLISGCGTAVTVDSLARPYAAGASYELTDGNPQAAGSLHYQEAAAYLRTALAAKGLYEAPPGAKPDLIVSVEIGVEAPQTHIERVLQPVDSPRADREYAEYMRRATNRDGEPPPLKPKEMRRVPVAITVYEKYLRLVARERAHPTAGRPPRQIWTVDVTSEGPDQDLQKHLPILIAAASEFIGEDTSGLKEIRIKDNAGDLLVER